MDNVAVCDGLFRELGHINTGTHAFIKRVRYPQNYNFKHKGWAYYPSFLETLKKLDCQRIIHIEETGNREQIWETKIDNYLRPGKYSTADDKRYLSVKHWRLKVHAPEDMDPRTYEEPKLPPITLNSFIE